MTTPLPELPNCHPTIWRKLCEIYSKRLKAQNEEQNMLKHRKVLEEELADMGSKDSSQRRQKCTEYYDTCKAIEQSRALIKWLADKLGAVIQKGQQGELWTEAADEEDEEPKAPLFHIKPDEEAAANVGRPAANKQAAPPRDAKDPSDIAIEPEGNVPLWAAALDKIAVGKLHLAQMFTRSLKDAGLVKVGDICRFIGEGKVLTNIPGIDDDAAAVIVMKIREMKASA